MRSLPLALLLACGTAVAAEPALKNGFSPHPLASEVVAANGMTTMAAKGYGSCSTARTTEEPAFAFTLEEPLSDLRVSIDRPAAVVLPDGGFVCVTERVLWLKEWKAGRYQVLLFGPSEELRAVVRLEQPTRLQAELKVALEKLAAVTLSSSTPGNPIYHAVTTTTVFTGGSSGVGCGPDALSPLARIKVPYAATWSVVSRSGAPLVLVPASGRCLLDLRAQRLEPGDYVLWGATDPASPKTDWDLAFVDEGRPPSFGPAPTYDLGQLKKPMALAGKTSDGSWGSARATACKGLPQTPSFYVKGSPGLKNVELRLWKDGGVGDSSKMHVYGPLEDAKADLPMRCDLWRPVFRELKGTYAVFILGGEAPSLPVVALAHRADVPQDPVAAALPIPEAPGVAERVPSIYYPYFRDGIDPKRYFLSAPKQLFVATDEPGFSTPGLVLVTRDLTVDVLFFDGQVKTVGKSQILPALPSPIVWPAAPPPPPVPVETLEAAILAAGPAEVPFVAQYHALEGQVNACVQAWLLKNDPAWVARNELLWLSNGEPRGEREPTGADKACGVARLAPAAKKLIQQVNASRAKSGKTFLEAVKKRFR